MKVLDLRGKIAKICRDFYSGRTFYASEYEMVKDIEAEIKAWKIVKGFNEVEE